MINHFKQVFACAAELININSRGWYTEFAEVSPQLFGRLLFCSGERFMQMLHKAYRWNAIPIYYLILPTKCSAGTFSEQQWCFHQQ
jgi:hypothetical protein